MKEGNKYAHETGLKGEKHIDEFMLKNGWSSEVERKKYRRLSQNKGGEIDRIFSKKEAFLICEIKTVQAGRLAKLTPAELVQFPSFILKARQIENLALVANQFAGKKQFLRVFFVVIDSKEKYLNYLLPQLQRFWTPTLKLCSADSKSLIYSWIPELVPRGSRVLPWQAEAR